ncbi:MAG TPA: IS3 family transposase, partial [Polyangiaceae bacterium]|nr:IS3 family transposase [Polyangiaceae bacterium]
MSRAKEKFAEAFRPLPIITGLVRDLLCTREELVAQNMMLRQQLIVASRKVKKPSFRPHERGLMVLLLSILRRWRDAVLLVKPETIMRSHREGFRIFWKRKSKSGTARPSPLPKETIELIARMSKENRLWGAERIRGELLKLGIHVSKRTIQKYMRQAGIGGPRDGQTWKTFLENHSTWACDLLQLHDVWCTAPSAPPRSARVVGLRATRPVPGLRALRLRPIFAFFIIDVNT